MLMGSPVVSDSELQRVEINTVASADAFEVVSAPANFVHMVKAILGPDAEPGADEIPEPNVGITGICALAASSSAAAVAQAIVIGVIVNPLKASEEHYGPRGVDRAGEEAFGAVHEEFVGDAKHEAFDVSSRGELSIVPAEGGPEPIGTDSPTKARGYVMAHAFRIEVALHLDKAQSLPFRGANPEEIAAAFVRVDSVKLITDAKVYTPQPFVFHCAERLPVKSGMKGALVRIWSGLIGKIG